MNDKYEYEKHTKIISYSNNNDKYCKHSCNRQ